MSENRRTNIYAPASAPDLVARLREAIEANETTRVLMEECAATLRLHLQHADAHLHLLIADLEGRADK
jgi:hypothetical protein